MGGHRGGHFFKILIFNSLPNLCVQYLKINSEKTPDE